MTNIKRSKKQYDKIAKKMILYYFENPNGNSYDIMTKKFNVSEPYVRRIITKAFKDRLERVQKISNY